MFTRKRLLIALAVVIVGLVLVDSWKAGWKVVRPWSVDQLVIARNTTFIEEPLRADGYPDYIAFLNERLSQGVTPENNAAVPLLRAMGPQDIDASIRAEFYRRLGIEPLPETGAYFVDWFKHWQSIPEAERPATTAAETVAVDDLSTKMFESAMDRPWSRDEFPALASWLESNQAQLDLVVAASRLPRFYSPLVASSDPPTLVSVLLPLVGAGRDLSRALMIRAMLHLENGDVDAAWKDLMACRRLGRLMGQAGTLVELLVGYAIEGLAVAGQETLLAEAQLNTEQCIEMQKELDRLAPLPKLADKLDQFDRLSMLDAALCFAREGPEGFEQLIGGGTSNNPFPEISRRGVNWNVTLEVANRWMDRMVDVARIEDPRVRAAESARIESDIKNLEVDQGKGAAIVSRGQASERNGEILVSLFMPALSSLAQAEARTKTDHDLLRVGVALAHFKAENGQYPESLAELVPKYIKTLPVDAFAGTPFVYRRRENGYLLYSPGPNQRDEEGRGYDENADDHFIEIPRRAKAKPPAMPAGSGAEAEIDAIQ